MTGRDTGGTKGDVAAKHGAQRRLAEACVAGDWDGARTAADAGASAYRNDILERLLEMPETRGVVETIEWLGRHHAARGNRLNVIGGDEEIAGAVVLQRAGVSAHLSARKLAALAVHLDGAGLDPARLATFRTPTGWTLIEERVRALPGSAGLEGVEALGDLLGGTGALTAAETAALERARAVHALSTGTRLERVDAAVAGGDAPSEALAGLLCEAMERDGGLSRCAFAHLRATAPAVLAEAFDTKAGSRDETPMDLVGFAALGGEAAEGMVGDVADLKVVLGLCAVRQGPGGEFVFVAALSGLVFGDAPARARARAVAGALIEARPGLRYWETDEAPYVLELCEGVAVCPWAMAGDARAEVERIAHAVLPRGGALRRRPRLLRGLVRTALGRAVLARATARDPALAPAWTVPPAPGEEPVLWAALALSIAAGPEVQTGWTRDAPRPMGGVRRRGRRAHRAHRRRPSLGAHPGIYRGPTGTHPARGSGVDAARGGGGGTGRRGVGAPRSHRAARGRRRHRPCGPTPHRRAAQPLVVPGAHHRTGAPVGGRHLAAPGVDATHRGGGDHATERCRDGAPRPRCRKGRAGRDLRRMGRRGGLPPHDRTAGHPLQRTGGGC